ncbi:MAG TPA: YcxB family protein [Cytophagaceae bacterium]
MIVRTKKYQLPKKTYVKLALINLLKKQWYFIFLPIAIGCLAFIWPKAVVWFIVFAILIPVLYLLFWLIQFAGVTQLEQNKVMFEKLSYEIDSRQVLIKLNSKQGSPLQWSMFKSAYKDKDHFLLVVSKAQLIHLPFKIFNSENDIKFVETILRRKEYIK